MKRTIASIVLCLGCGGPPTLTVDMPLHLEDHLDAATVTGSEVPANPPQAVEWRFDEPQPDWKLTPSWHPTIDAATWATTSGGLLVTLTAPPRLASGSLRGGIHVDLPDWDRSEWAGVVIRARADSASSVNVLGLGFNVRGRAINPQIPFQYGGQATPIVRDGAIQTYRLRVAAGQAFDGPWRQLALFFGTDGEPGSIEILSVSVVPMGALYAEEPHAVMPVTIGERAHRTLVTHAPGRFSYRVRVPEGGRLDAGLGVLGDDDPVTFRVTVQAGNREEEVFEERYTDRAQWGQRSVDLATYAGQTVTLALETAAREPGTVAFWAAPTLSGTRRGDRPNVILYVIDGGGADYMSVYGYNRRTTPNLERLAAEGALFEHAYSTSSWTKPSTASFMTSLHNSVLGNTGNEVTDPLSPQAVTMAEHFHRAGYGTAVFTPNPNASTVSGLERSVDVVPGFAIQYDAQSSVKLHQAFWSWREAYPGQPYWVHFQTTDVHALVGRYRAAPPFTGLFISPEQERAHNENHQRLSAAGGQDFWSGAWERTGISRIAYYTSRQALYDQSMAHNDYQLGRLVDRLKASGEWQNTLLIVTADHSITAAGSRDMGIALLDPLPPPWTNTDNGHHGGPMLRPSVSRVPLIVVWPGHIAGGQRFDDAVSLIDLLPTVLDFAGLPRPDVMQGQSLVPLVRGQAGWVPRPVILDQFDADPVTGQLTGRIEIVDGRWGASLWIGKEPDDSTLRRPWPLLMYDLWSDPLALRPQNEQRPDLVTRYTAFLEQQWRDHQALATRFRPGTPVALTPEQLERLRALGYIR